MRTRVLFLLSSLALLAACADSPTAPRLAPPETPSLQMSEGRGVLHRYVAIGTSVSMGWASDGVFAGLQEHSWPAQLARLAHREITQPYIAPPGCRAPLVAPLLSFSRLSGEPAALPPGGSFRCTPLLPGVTLPTQNLAISSATAAEALLTTPETKVDPFYSRLYPRVLPPGATQVSAMVAQNPKLVSVEFGGSEVVGAYSGVAIPGVSLVPLAQFVAPYTQILNEVESVTKMALLVGLVDNIQTFPSLRTGAEIYADRVTLLTAFNVSVNADCNGSPNLIFTPTRIPLAVLGGLALRNAGSPLSFNFSCADQGLGVPDGVLTPPEAAVVNGLLAQMDAFIAQQAAARGYAHFRLQELYGLPGAKLPYSSLVQMTSQQPYGPYVSLDGVHPSPAGHAVIAAAAARALNETYGLGIPVAGAFAAR